MHFVKSHSDASRRKYLPEIDGLRAFAVVSVLLFHALPYVVPGGFIGVDIFFTVSGFVIARTYLVRLINGSTSLRQFFLRRIRRLAPAYAVVLAASTIAALVLLDPPQLKKYGVSLLAQPFYLQNVTFWLEGDYFETALSKPLLHTWSLAVEEQFYLIFGLVILTLRWKRGLLWPLILIGCALSYIGGQALVTLSPKTAFYLVPFRVWEFGAGIIAFIVSQRIEHKPARASDIILFALGCGGVVASVFAFGESTTFPGWQSALSTASVALLVVLFDVRPSQVYAPLRALPVRRVGELSYSLYLWHWPILVFGAFASGQALSPVLAVASLGLSYLLSEWTYRIIEDPVRTKVRLPHTNLLLRSWILSSVALGAVGLFLVWSNGGLFRYGEPVRSIYSAALEPANRRCSISFRIAHPRAEMCPLNDAANAGRPGVLLIGDSHASTMKEGLGRMADSLGTALWLTTRNCDLNEFESRAYCSTEVLSTILRQAQDHNINRLVAISRWHEDIDTGEQYKRLYNSAELIEHYNFDLYMAETVPSSPIFEPDTLIALAETSRLPVGINIEEYIKQVTPLRNSIKMINNSLDVNIKTVKTSTDLCKSGTCDVLTDEYPNYRDYNHLSSAGIDRVVGSFRSALSRDE